MKKKNWIKLKVEMRAKYLAYHKLWMKMVEWDYFIEFDKVNTKEAMKCLSSINKMREKLGEPTILLPVN